MNTRVELILASPLITPELAQEANDIVELLLDELPDFQDLTAHIEPDAQYVQYVRFCIDLSAKLTSNNYGLYEIYALDIARFALHIGDTTFAESGTLFLKELIGVDPYTEFLACHQLSEIHDFTGNLELAEEFKNEALFLLNYYQEAKEQPVFQESGHYTMCHSHFLLLCSRGQERLGNYTFALDIVKMVLDKVEVTQDHSKLPPAHLQYGNIMASENKLKYAEDAYSWAVDWSEKLDLLPQKAESYQALAITQWKNEKPSDSLDSLRKARECFNNLRDPEKVNELDSFIASVEWHMSRE